MLSYVCKVILVTIIEIAIFWGVSNYYHFEFLTVMFFGSSFLVLFAFFAGSRGDFFTKNSELHVFKSLAGDYTPKPDKLTLRVGPFLIGSILCLIICFILAYI